MCGIAGVFTRSGADADVVRRMVQRLVHRGPDAAGYWGNAVYSAGMRRLSIVDVAGGAQPLYDETGSVVVLYNGEIYNYPQLRRELERDGVRIPQSQRRRSDLPPVSQAWPRRVPAAGWNVRGCPLGRREAATASCAGLPGGEAAVLQPPAGWRSRVRVRDSEPARMPASIA